MNKPNQGHVTMAGMQATPSDIPGTRGQYWRQESNHGNPSNGVTNLWYVCVSECAP